MGGDVSLPPSPGVFPDGAYPSGAGGPDDADGPRGADFGVSFDCGGEVELDDWSPVGSGVSSIRIISIVSDISALESFQLSLGFMGQFR